MKRSWVVPIATCFWLVIPDIADAQEGCKWKYVWVGVGPSNRIVRMVDNPCGKDLFFFQCFTVVRPRDSRLISAECREGVAKKNSSKLGGPFYWDENGGSVYYGNTGLLAETIQSEFSSKKCSIHRACKEAAQSFGASLSFEVTSRSCSYFTSCD